MRKWQAWLPGSLLTVGVLLNGTLVSRRSGITPIAGNLQTVADTIMGIPATDIRVPPDEERVAGYSDYIVHEFKIPDGRTLNIYVGYYDEQRQGKTIHSPRNCLPGNGWEPISRRVVDVPSTRFGSVGINRYELVREQERAIVFYWYQGRGRVASNEYLVKYQLLRDAALRGRTEEAIVRIVVPVIGDDVDSADRIGRELAGPLIDDVERVLPTF
ncbi:MAG TPA: EpsI family protein [Gemmatimonadales bacterium]|nr:EpsI family protein [Gemmatimonadales bacterium]